MAEKSILTMSGSRRILKLIREILFPFEIEWKTHRNTLALQAQQAIEVEEAPTSTVIPKLDGYTTKQLIELRSLCVGSIEGVDEIQKRADTLLRLEYIDRELATRERWEQAA